MIVDQTGRLIRQVEALSHGIQVSLRNLFDTVYANDEDARAFLGVSKLYFAANYKQYCGIKQGNQMTYRKSDLLARMEQLRRQGGGVNVDTDDTNTD